MKEKGSKVTRKALSGLLVVALGAGVFPLPAAAQDADTRLRRIESEIRALQRVVFPNSDGRFFEPEVTAQPQGQSQQPQAGIPSTTALTDVLARLDALETQLARLTARSEENANAIEEMRLEMTEFTAAQARPAPVQPTGVITPPGEAGGAGVEAAAQQAEPAGPSPERIAAVQAIVKPSTGDAGDDEYVYGFRLWDAGFYPEAQQQLASFVEAYPDHWRVTYGRNLLGRAFLDAGQPRDAATHFFANYQDDKTAARAPDSLLYLADAMIALDDTRRACIALAEFGDTYPALATGRLKEQYDSNRGRVDCE